MQDAVPIAACIDSAYATYSNTIPDLPAVSDGIAEDISKNIVWVAEQARQIVGVLIMYSRPDHLMLANVAVIPTKKGKGLGKALMALADHLALMRNKPELRLSTHVAMPENVALYQHLGWHEIGRTSTKVFMSKAVKPANLKS